jgi:hypothetical protein
MTNRWCWWLAGREILESSLHIYWCHCLALGISSSHPPTKETVIMIECCRGSAVYHTRLKITVLFGGSKSRPLIWMRAIKAYICQEKNYVPYLRICGSFKSANNWVCKSQIHKSQKYVVRKLQIRKLPNLRKFPEYKKKHSSAKLRICDLRNLFADRPPLLLL